MVGTEPAGGIFMPLPGDFIDCKRFLESTYYGSIPVVILLCHRTDARIESGKAGVSILGRSQQ